MSSTRSPRVTSAAIKASLQCGRFAAALFTATLLPAQIPSGRTAAESEPVRLPTFTVSAEEDTGYVPQSDVSGSRLNKPLRDIAAPINVLTSELLNDIGALNATAAFAFMGNVRSDDTSAAAPDIDYVRPAIRGLTSLNTQTIDFFPVYTDLDRYNLDRVGVARGPNAFLFGVGSPTGVITGTAKTAGFRNRTTVEGHFDNWGSLRGSLDTNRVLVDDRLALRVVGLQQDIRYAIKPTWKKDKRLFATITAKLVDRENFRTTVRGSYEMVNAENLYGNVILPQQNIATWVAAGRPIQLAPSTTVLPGTTRFGTRLVQQPGLPTMNWTGQLATTAAVTTPVFTENIYPYNLNIKGPDGVGPNRWRNGVVYVDQEIGRDLILQGAYFRGEEQNFWPIKVVGSTISADPNAVLPNGQPNPNVGKLYVEDGGQTDTRLGNREVYRLQASYTFDITRRNERIGKWISQFQVFGLLEDRADWTATERLQTVNTTPLPGAPANLANASNRVFHRAYLDFANGMYYFRTQPYRDVVVSNGVRATALPVLTQTTALTEIKSQTLGFEGRFWGDRIIATYGLRTDESTTSTAKPVAGPDGVFTLARHNPVTRDVSQKFEPVTKALVIHPLPIDWLDFTYSESENYTGAAAALAPIGQTKGLPATGGKGKDYGVRVHLWDGKVSVSLNKYESMIVNQYTSVINPIITPVNAIWEAIGQQDKNIMTGASTRDTNDSASAGYELTATFNPNKHLRFYLTASKSDAKLSNVNPYLRQYLDANMPIWSEARYQSLPAGSSTVAGQLANVKSQAEQFFGQEGIQSYNNRLYTGAFVGTYSFLEGRLNGLSVSANVRYLGDAYVGVPVVGGIADSDNPYVEKGYLSLGLTANYVYKAKRGYTLFTRLTAANVGDWDGRVIVMARNGAGLATAARWLEGTSLSLTTGVSF
jgi:iron complex outermembrane recepter protein